MQDFQDIVTSASRVIQVGRICVNKALKKVGLSSAQADVLLFLYTHGDGIRQEDIVAGVEVSKPAISRTVHSLEQKGYLRRKQGTADKRSYIVWLTPKAREAQDFVLDQYRRLVDAARVGITDEKNDIAIEVFRMVLSNLEDYLKKELC